MPETAPESTLNTSDLPYSPSWIDRLTTWIDNLSILTWVFYALFFFLTALLTNIILWIDGTLSVGSIDPLETTFSIIVIYWLALYHYLSRVGSRSLQSFRPLLDVDDSEMEQIDFRLAALPRGMGRLAIILGLLLQAASILGDPAIAPNLDAGNTLFVVGDIVFTTFVSITFFCLVIRSIRQLRMVGSLHARAKNISMLDLRPAHAFAALTSRTGISLIFILVIGYAYSPSSFSTALDALTFVAIALLAIVIFVGPLAGMRARLEKAKDRALSEVNALLHTANERLHSKVRKNDNKDMRETHSAISALIAERELLEKTSTWPWDTRTIRGFASTLLLPIILLLVTQLIERFF